MTHLEKTYQVNFSATTVNKSIFVVVVKTKDEQNKKIEQAQALSIPVMTIDDFKKTYI